MADIRTSASAGRRQRFPAPGTSPRACWSSGRIPRPGTTSLFSSRKGGSSFYCAIGQRSALAADILQKLGYQEVAHLEISFNAWKETGGPVDKVPVREEYRKQFQRKQDGRHQGKAKDIFLPCLRLTPLGGQACTRWLAATLRRRLAQSTAAGAPRP